MFARANENDNLLFCIWEAPVNYDKLSIGIFSCNTNPMKNFAVGKKALKKLHELNCANIFVSSPLQLYDKFLRIIDMRYWILPTWTTWIAVLHSDSKWFPVLILDETTSFQRTKQESIFVRQPPL